MHINANTNGYTIITAKPAGGGTKPLGFFSSAGNGKAARADGKINGARGSPSKNTTLRILTEQDLTMCCSPTF